MSTDEIDFHRFDSYREYVSLVAEATVHPDANYCNPKEGSRTKNSKFTGTKDFPEAIKTAREGWDYGLDQLPIKDGLLADAGIYMNNSVAGALPNIPAYIDGQPEDMFMFNDTTDYNLPELTIYVQLRYNSGWSVREALEYCDNVMQIVNELQSTHRLEVIGVFDKNTRQRFITWITLKSFDEPMVLNNLAFAFHPSFFRRLHFAHCESLPHYIDGYGYAVSEKKVKDYIKANNGSKPAIYLPDMEHNGSTICRGNITKMNTDVAI